MELVSPIVFRKLDINVRSNYCESLVLYDNHSKKFVVISDSGIKIFNKNGSKLKKSLKIKLPRDNVNKIAIDKSLRYILAICENKTAQLVNLRTENCEILRYNFTSIHGMFFIHNSQNLIVLTNEDVNFCLVFPHKLVYFQIIQQSSSKDENEVVRELKTVQLGSTAVTKFHYNLRYMILATEKSDRTIDFYNLSSEKYYSKNYKFKYPCKCNASSSQNLIMNLFGFFRRSSNPEEEYAQEEFDKGSRYKKTQFFLENIYRKLYLICMNYEVEEIQIFNVSSLISITKVLTIPFAANEISTLQFIDNLILLHNFESCDTIAIDIKSENPGKVLFKKYPMTNYEILEHNKNLSKDLIKIQFDFDINDKSKSLKKNLTDEDGYDVRMKIEYQKINAISISMLCCANYFLYERNIIVRGNVIEERHYNGTTFYEVRFDPSIYLENTIAKHEAVFHLIRRAHSKEVILHALNELIKTKNSINVIKVIFNKLVKQLQKCLYNQKLIGLTNQVTKLSGNLRDFLGNPQSGDIISQKPCPSDLPNPPELIWIRKKTIVKQTDIYESLLQALDDYSNILKPEYILKLFVHYSNSLVSFKIPIQSSFYRSVINLIRKIENFSFVAIFLQYHSIPDSLELAKYLIDEASNADVTGPSALQLGLDMLIRLKRYPEVLVTLLKNKRLKDAIAFSKRYMISMETISRRNLRRLKALGEENVDMVTQFVNSN